MKWKFWIYRYIHHYCLARGLSKQSLITYEINLNSFEQYMIRNHRCEDPGKLKICEVFEYLEYLKKVKGNGQSSLIKQATIIKNFYHGLVSLGFIEYYKNPLRDMQKLKAAPERMRDILNRKEVKRLLLSTNEATILGVRDRAIILLLFTTGIRASELCGLQSKDVDLEGQTIKVMGKGQRERIVPMNDETVEYLKKYIRVRGEISRLASFFKTRTGNGVTRKGLYDRIKRYVRLARISKTISAHNLRHSFATDMIQRNVNIVTLQKILGHRSITSTIRYLRITIEDLRVAIRKHPVTEFNDILKKHLGDVRMPYQLSISGFK
jgi:site-specific recombinase XerD